MIPNPYGPTSNQPIYQQPPPLSIPPQGVYAPFGGMVFCYVQDPMTELASCQSLLIRQEPEFFEKLSGCEQPNIYHVFGNTPMGTKYLFKCIEKSGWCMRRCFVSSQRSFDMDIIHCSSQNQLGMGYTTPFAVMKKPFMCTMCCLCRPEIEVILKSSNSSVGKVKHICTVCDPTFELYSIKGGLKYIVTADCCQCALRCRGFLGKTSRGVFNILNAKNKQNVGTITKEPANLSEIVTDADTYLVQFPLDADPNDKLLLTGVAIMIDYQFFETDANEEYENRHGRKKVRV